VGGPREIIDDGREGRLVAPRDPQAWATAIRAVLDAPQGGAAMGRAGRERVERDFTFEQQARAMIEVYREAVGDLAKGSGHP